MYKIAIIGDRESVLSFRAIGFDVADVQHDGEAAQALKQFADNFYAIIFVTEQVAENLHDEIAVYNDNPIPAVIVLPNNQGTNGMGMQAVKKSVERAVGSDILFKD